MDGATLALNVSITNRKRKAYGSKRTHFLLKSPRFFDSFYRQFCSLPDSLMYYISKDRKRPKLCQKILQTCRQFFIKNPILVFQGIDSSYINTIWHIFMNRKNVDMTFLKSKIWIINRLSINGYYISEKFFNDSFILKIYQCDIKELQLSGLRIFLKDLKFLAGKCEKVHFSGITVIKEDGAVGALENIFEVLPKVKDFHCTLGDAVSQIITSKTVQNLLQMSHFYNLDEFNLNNITEYFDIASFYDHIKTNQKAKIALHFCNQLSRVYKARLQTIVNEIIATENRNFKAPRIDFSGIDHISSLTMSMNYIRDKIFL